MNIQVARRALLALGHPDASIEIDTQEFWIGEDSERTYLDADEVLAKISEIEEADAANRESAVAKLKALGLTDDEVAAFKLK